MFSYSKTISYFLLMIFTCIIYMFTNDTIYEKMHCSVFLGATCVYAPHKKLIGFWAR